MFARILTYPKDRSFFLFGPRSTGKSTWVQEAFPSGLFVDLLKAATFTKLTAQPDRLGGNLSLFNPCLDLSGRNSVAGLDSPCRPHPSVPVNPNHSKIIPTDTVKRKSVRRITHALLYRYVGVWQGGVFWEQEHRWCLGAASKVKNACCKLQAPCEQQCVYT